MPTGSASLESHMVIKDRSPEAHTDNHESSVRLSLEAQQGFMSQRTNVAAETPVHNLEMAAMLNGFTLTGQNNQEQFNQAPGNLEQVNPPQVNAALIDSALVNSLFNPAQNNPEQGRLQPLPIPQNDTQANGEQAAMGIFQSVMGGLQGIGESFASSDSTPADNSDNSDTSSDSNQTAQSDDSQQTVSDDQWPPAWMLRYATNS